MEPDERGLLPGELDPREPSCAYPGCGLPEFVHGKSGHPFRPSVEPAGAEQRIEDAMDEIGRLRLLLDALAVERGTDFGRGYAEGATAERARLAREPIDPGAAAMAAHSCGQCVKSRKRLPTQASDSPEKP